jgi:hypothetical protein
MALGHAGRGCSMSVVGARAEVIADCDDDRF